MKDHFTQFEDGVSDDTEPASTIEVVLATVVLALLLQIFWRCCSSFYRNEQVKKLKIPSSAASAATMDPSKIAAVEKILNYTFKDKRLLVEALTHPSCGENTSYDRLEFIGDAALGLTVATHFFCKEPKLDSDNLTQLRKESVSNERLGRLADKHRLNQFVICKDTNLLHAKKIWPEVVESLAGAVYLDVNFDLTKLWKIFEDVLMMDEITVPDDYRTSAIINGAQDELYGLCGKRGWGNPQYRVVKKVRPRNETKYVGSVEIETGDCELRKLGDEKSTERDARNSAAYQMLHALQQ